MTWKTFYDNFDIWSPATFRRRLYELSNFGPAEQIMEVADYLDDADPFIRAALQHGVVFSPRDLFELVGMVKQPTLEEAIAHSLAHGVVFTHDDIMDFDGLVSKGTFRSLVNAGHFTPEELEDFDDALQLQIDESGLSPKKRCIIDRPDDFFLAYALYDMTTEEDKQQQVSRRGKQR